MVGQVQDGCSLVSAAERLLPDVIVSDISMPGLDGIAAASAILRAEPGHPDHLRDGARRSGMVERGMAAGAMGYVLKVLAGDDLMPAVRAALRGERHVSQALHSWIRPSRWHSHELI